MLPTLSLRAPTRPLAAHGPAPRPRAEQFPFISGMRALGALQVVLLHCMSAFWPVLAPALIHTGWRDTLLRFPWSFLCDGNVGVDIFFVMSGFVLAQSFLLPGRTFGPSAVKRAIRLVLPVVASALVAIPLLHLLPSARQQAAAVSGSHWLSNLSPAGGGLLAGLHHTLDLMLWNGSGGVFTPVTVLARHLPVAAVQSSVNPPVWSMHWELWGSFLLLGLARLYSRMPVWVDRLLFAAALVLVGTSLLGLFLLGFVLYVGRERLIGLGSDLGPGLGVRRAAGRLAGCLLLLAGVACACLALLVDPAWGTGVLGHLPGLHAGRGADLLDALSAGLLFCGVVVWAPARHGLSWRPLTWVGDLSFSVYLLHFPVLLTLGCLVFRMTAPHGRLLGVGAGTVVCMITSLLIAGVFVRVADRPSARLASRVGTLLQRKQAAEKAVQSCEPVRAT